MFGIKHSLIIKDIRKGVKRVFKGGSVSGGFIDNKFVKVYSNKIYSTIIIPKKVVKYAVERNRLRRCIRQNMNILNGVLIKNGNSEFISSEGNMVLNIDSVCLNKPLFYIIVILDRNFIISELMILLQDMILENYTA